MKIKRNIIQINEKLCDGCGHCIPDCAEGALEIVNGKVKIISENFCDGLGSCINSCPQGALTIIQKKTNKFNKKAALKHLKSKSNNLQSNTHTYKEANKPIQDLSNPNSDYLLISKKTTPMNWPIQIELIPPDAHFLKQANLVISADCALPILNSIEKKFLHNKVLMIGCPKLDNIKHYEVKFVEIFKKNKINTITTVSMTVPCCSKLQQTIEKTLRKANCSVKQQLMKIDPHSWSISI